MAVVGQLQEIALDRDTVLTIGVFDGVHLGHQHLLKGVVARARELGCLAAAITFDPHPQRLLAPHIYQGYLTNIEERIAFLQQLGLQVIAILEFTPQVAQTPAEEFVRQARERLRMVELWVGPDFALGRGRQGTVPALRRLGRRYGFRVKTVEPLRIDGKVVSSTEIRSLLANGDIRRAARLLGRFPTLVGKVAPGMGRGRELGFPTANIALDGFRALPADGVYAVRAHLGQETYSGVANIGLRPSFGTGPRTIETYLFGLESDLYGQAMTLELIERLRPEIRFPDTASLIQQIRADVERARAFLQGETPAEKRG